MSNFPGGFSESTNLQDEDILSGLYSGRRRETITHTGTGVRLSH